MASATLTGEASSSSSPSAGPSGVPASSMRSSSRQFGSRNPFLDPEAVAQAQQRLPSTVYGDGNPFVLPQLSFHAQHTASSYATADQGSSSTVYTTAEEQPEPTDTVMAVSTSPSPPVRIDQLNHAFSVASIAQRGSSMPLDSPLPRASSASMDEDTAVATMTTTTDPTGVPPPLPPRRRSHSSESLRTSFVSNASPHSQDSRQSRDLVDGDARRRASPSQAQSLSASPGTSRTTGPAVTIPTVAGTDYPEPTTIPTPGRPLLRDGKLMLMPPSWESCAKCQGTGFKHADPSQPHDSCWRSYGRHYTPALVTSSDVLDQAMLLQRPLPMCVRPGGLPPPALPPSTSFNGSTGSPGPAPSSANRISSSSFYAPPPPRRISSGAIYSTPYSLSTSSPSRRPIAAAVSNPSQPPTSTTQSQRRRSPPRVNRAAAANEGGEDPQGEAPPSYEDVVKVPQNFQLPPQRTGAAVNGGGGGNGEGSSNTNNAQFNPPPNPPPPISSSSTSPSRRPGFPPVDQRPPFLSSIGSHHSSNSYPSQAAQPHASSHSYSYSNHPSYPNPHLSIHQTYPYQPHSHLPPQPSIQMVGGARPPPPNALVLRPGDVRIGGILCHKCGGSGIRESLFFGDETCSRCSGLGRIR